MGIDVYLRWKGMTPEEQDAQITGFSNTSGHVGYLREAYHGNPYATKVLVPEGFDADADAVTISAQTLRERLPATLEAAKLRQVQLYKIDPPKLAVLQSYEDFVALAEKKEAETGEPCQVVVSY